MIPTSASGQPAVAMHVRDHDEVLRLHSVQVLTVTASGIARVVAFLDKALFAKFGLPAHLPHGRHVLIRRPALTGGRPAGR
jgi:RNA polymerase sigma-70 factor (ECF subfamily)